MSAATEEGSAVGIWKRAIEPDSGVLPAEEARALLRLKLANEDLDRADVLAAKAKANQLTPKEERELENYLTVGSTLEFLKSKARRSLQQTASAQ